MKFNEHTPPPNPSMNPPPGWPTASRCHICGLPVENEFHPCLQSMSTGNPLDDPRIGLPFGGSYVIEAWAGEGGMSVVYKARHKLLDSVVAIKILKPMLAMDQAKLARFQQEAISVARLNHPNIISIHHFEIPQNGEPFLVMDFVDGPPLSDVILRERQITLDRCVKIFYLVCDALQHAHEAGVIHRDVKPSNILLGREPGGKETPKIVDFGIAKLIDADTGSPSMANMAEVFGSPLYMSPEQCAAKQMDTRSDIYSTGCVIFESLTGQPPFVGKNPQEIMQMHVFERTPRVSERRANLPHAERLDAIILKAMAKHPAERYQSMQQLKEELESIGTRERISKPREDSFVPPEEKSEPSQEVPDLWDEPAEMRDTISQYDTTNYRKPTGQRKSIAAQSSVKKEKELKAPKPSKQSMMRLEEASPEGGLLESAALRRGLLVSLCLIAALGAVSLAVLVVSNNKPNFTTADDWHTSIVAAQKHFDGGRLKEAKKAFDQDLQQSTLIKDGFAHGRTIAALQELIDVSTASKENADKYSKQLEQLLNGDAKNSQSIIERLNSLPAKDPAGTVSDKMGLSKQLEQMQSVDAGAAQAPTETPTSAPGKKSEKVEKNSAGTHLLLSRAVEAANLEFRAGEISTAKQMLEKTVVLCAEYLDAGSPAEIRSYLLLAMIAMEEGRLDEAQTNLNKGLALAKQFHDKRMVAQMTLMLARLSVDQFQPDEALATCNEAEKLFKHVDGNYSHGVAAVRIIQGNALHLQKKFDDARNRYAESLKILEALSDHDLPVESDCRMQTARLLSDSMNDPTVAGTTLETAINSLEGKEPRTPREWRYLAQALSNLSVLKTAPNSAKVSPLKTRAFAIWKRTEGDVNMAELDVKTTSPNVRTEVPEAKTEPLPASSKPSDSTSEPFLNSKPDAGSEPSLVPERSDSHSKPDSKPDSNSKPDSTSKPGSSSKPDASGANDFKPDSNTGSLF